jgi:hypothetical protein
MASKMAKRRIISTVWALAAALGVVAVIGLFWLFGAVSETFRHILPGGSDMTSTSIEPYNIKLVTAIKGGKPISNSEKPFVWQIQLPRAFVISEMGSNDLVYKLLDDGSNYHSVSLSADLSPNGQSFVPTATQLPNEPISKSFVIHLRNDAPGPRSENYPRCVPQHLQKELLGPLGYVGAHDNLCSNRNLRCSIDIYSSGWNITFAVTHDLYADPDKACLLVTDFLEKYTVYRDEIK